MARKDINREFELSQNILAVTDRCDIGEGFHAYDGVAGEKLPRMTFRIAGGLRPFTVKEVKTEHGALRVIGYRPGEKNGIDIAVKKLSSRDAARIIKKLPEVARIGRTQRETEMHRILGSLPNANVIRNDSSLSVSSDIFLGGPEDVLHDVRMRFRRRQDGDTVVIEADDRTQADIRQPLESLSTAEIFRIGKSLGAILENGRKVNDWRENLAKVEANLFRFGLDRQFRSGEMESLLNGFLDKTPEHSFEAVMSSIENTMEDILRHSKASDAKKEAIGDRIFGLMAGTRVKRIDDAIDRTMKFIDDTRKRTEGRALIGGNSQIERAQERLSDLAGMQERARERFRQYSNSSSGSIRRGV